MRFRKVLSYLALFVFAVASAYAAPTLPTTTTEVITPTGAVTRQVITFQATVVPAAATGFVNFYDTASAPRLLGSAAVVSGVAVLKTPLALGTSHSITAVYQGDHTYLGSKSAAQTIAVALASPTNLQTASIFLSANGPDTYTLGAGVEAFGIPTPTGNIVFHDETLNTDLANDGVPFGPDFTPGSEVRAVPTDNTNAPMASEYVATGDMRGTGIKDVITVITGANLVGATNGGNAGGQVPVDPQLCVNLGVGDGTFAAPACYPMPNAAQSDPRSEIPRTNLVVADFNNDGKLDVAFLYGNLSGTDTLYVFLGNGDGTLAPAVTTIFSQVGVSVLSAADFNNDGKLDIIFSRYNNVDNTDLGLSFMTALGNGNGTFSAPIAAPPLGNNTVAGYDFTVGDFNGDGNVDVAIRDRGVAVSGPAGSIFTADTEIFLGHGDNTFTLGQVIPNTPTSPDGAHNTIVCGDLRNNGILDIVTGSSYKEGVDYTGGYTDITVWRNDGTGNFTADTTQENFGSPFGQGTGSIILADYNGDGNLDIGGVSDGQYADYYAGDGTGQFTPTVISQHSSPSPTGGPVYYTDLYFAVADFNGDGRADMVISNSAYVTPASTIYAFPSFLTLALSDQYASVDFSPAEFYGDSTENVVSKYVPGASDDYLASTSPVLALDQVYLHYTTPPQPTIAAGATQPPVTTAVFSLGAAVGTGTDVVTVTVTGPGGYSKSYPGTLAAGVLTFTPATLTLVGTYTYTGFFNIPGPGNTAADALANQVVTAGPASVILITTPYPSPTLPGASHNFTVTVDDAFGNVATNFTGTVAITSTDPAATFTPASYTFTATDAGVHTFAGIFNTTGTQTLTVASAGLTSGVQTGIVVGKKTVGSGFVVTSNLNPSVYTNNVTFTATFPASDTPSETGTIQFLDGATVIGTGTITGNTASFSISTLAVGSHSITASYGGDSTWNPATTPALIQVVNKGTATITLSSSPNPSTLGQNVTFTAVFPVGTTPTGTVTFLDGTTTLGTGTIAKNSVTFSTTSLSVGIHPVTAVYGGDSNYNTATSSIDNQVVNKGTFNGPGDPTFTLASTPNPSFVEQSVTFTATFQVTATPVTPGTVITFLDGGTPIGTGTVNGTVATFTTSTLAAGTHPVTATFPGDANWNPATTNVDNQIVNKLTPGQGGVAPITLTSSLNPSQFKQSVTFTATVPTAPIVATGTVQFLDGTTVIGTGTVSNGTATFTTATLAVGTHQMTAVYLGDANFNGATSAPLAQVVNEIPLTLTVTPSTITLNPGQGASFTFTASRNFDLTFSTLSVPAGSTLTVSDPTISGSTTVWTAQLTTSATQASLEQRSIFNASLSGLALATLFPMLIYRKRLKKGLFATLMVFVLLGGTLGMSGCGATGWYGHAPTTFPVTGTVVSTLDAATATATANVTIQ